MQGKLAFSQMNSAADGSDLEKETSGEQRPVISEMRC